MPFIVAAASRSGRATWPFALFGLSLVALFASSAIYHAVRDPAAKRRLRVLDHSSIYVLIAGTYSAYSVGILGGWKGWVLFAAEWAIALGGIIMCAVRIDRFRAAGALVYIAMGWLIAPFFSDIRAAMPYESFLLLAAGGVAYTLGVVFYALKKVPWFHVIWHFFVLAGAACHATSILIAAGAV